MFSLIKYYYDIFVFVLIMQVFLIEREYLQLKLKGTRYRFRKSFLAEILIKKIN